MLVSIWPVVLHIMPSAAMDSSSLAHQTLKLWQCCHNILTIAVPVRARIPRHEQFTQCVIASQAGQTEQARLGDEIQRQVEFGKRLAALQILHLCNIVHCQVEILQLLELMQVLNFWDEVVLQVQDAQPWAQVAEQLYALDTLLMQSHLFQCRQHKLVVLRALRDGIDSQMKSRWYAGDSGWNCGGGSTHTGSGRLCQRTRRTSSSVIRPIVLDMETESWYIGSISHLKSF